MVYYSDEIIIWFEIRLVWLNSVRKTRQFNPTKASVQHKFVSSTQQNLTHKLCDIMRQFAFVLRIDAFVLNWRICVKLKNFSKNDVWNCRICIQLKCWYDEFRGAEKEWSSCWTDVLNWGVLIYFWLLRTVNITLY